MIKQFISPRAKVADNVYIGEGVRIYGETRIEEGCILEDYVIIGKPDMYALGRLKSFEVKPTVENYDKASDRITTIGQESIIGTGTHIYCGSNIGNKVETEDYIRVGWDTKIGNKTRIMFRAQVYVGVTIGDSCRIAGYIADNTVIEDHVAFFGSAIHDYPRRTTTYEYRPSPHICNGAIVAFGAQVIGGVRIGKRAYIGANAIVTRNVPDDTVVVFNNKQLKKNQWHGKLGQFEE